ncbi:MAG TPA: hypothetical protein VNH18_18750 [Bryobacteraceae bacterium]|nr:hypothetical protein [Bryobacteraceae bacterium]
MEWFANQPDLLAVLLSQVGLGGRIVFDTNVISPFFRNQKEGEIDLIAIPEGEPRLATAFEVKRFPIRRTPDDEWIILDQSKWDKLVSQCNRTAALGFHKVYGIVLTVADGRHHPAVSSLHRGSAERTFQQLYQFTHSHSLHPCIGLVFLEIVQPTARNWTDFGMVAAALDKQADPVEQSGNLSEQVEKWARKAIKKGRCALMDFDCSRTVGAPVTAHDEVKVTLGPKQTNAENR